MSSVSDEQVEATKVDVDRKKQAGKVPIAADEPDNLQPHQYTERNPLIPQPEPDANPLEPNLMRPSRSRSEENVLGAHRVSEVHDASSTTVAAEAEAVPQSVAVKDAQAEADEAAHRKRVRAGKKAAQTRAQNQKKRK